MALSASILPLTIALTQGGADAFVQGSVSTGLTGRQAYNLKAVAVSMANATLTSMVGANAYDWVVTVTRRSKTACPELSDSDVIIRVSDANALLTSGSAQFTGDRYIVFPLDMPIVEDTIYAQLDSAATGVTMSMIVRLEVELDTISDIDRLNLITRSLT